MALNPKSLIKQNKGLACYKPILQNDFDQFASGRYKDKKKLM